MHRIFRLCRAVSFLIISSAALQAQVLTVRVWPDKIPGSRTSYTYREETVLRNDGRIAFLKVTDPELQIYLPAADQRVGSAVVICPGGAYRGLAIGHEGEDVAEWFRSLGVVGVVLKYRLPSDSIMVDKTVGPLQDVQEAIRIVRRRSKEWGIDPRKIGIMGFSAGGHLAASASTLYDRHVYQPGDTTSARPDFSLLIYGVISMQGDITHPGTQESLLGKNPSPELRNAWSNELFVTSSTPPAFLVHAADDRVVPVENSIRYGESLKRYSIPFELHIYEKGGHGFGLAPKGGTESAWPEACKRWMKSHSWL